MDEGIVDTDVLIVGGGIAGLAAALAAKATARRVVLATQGPIARRSVSSYSGGQFALHVPERGEDGVREWLGGSPLTNGAVARALVRETEHQVQGLARYGVAVRPSPEGGYSIDRTRGERSLPSATLVSRMARTAKEAGVVLMPGFTAASLITYDGRCYGAVGFTERADWIQLSAGATVVALGGAGRVFQRGFGMTGDGYALLLEAGAQLVNFEFTKFFPLGLPTVRFGPQRPNRRFYDVEGLRVVNGRGEDIFEKHLGQSVQEAMRALYSRFVTMSWVVAKEWRDGPVFLDLTRIPRQVWQTVQDVSVQELAMRWGGSPALWNQLLTKHILPTRPIPHSFAGGARVGPDMSTGMVGLYAGGEIVDAFSDLGATPMYAVGPLPCALISGHIAGREAGIAASRETRPRQLPSSRYSEDVNWLRTVADKSEGIAPVAVMNEISDVMMANAGPLRNRASMLDGLGKVHQLEAKLSQLRAPTMRALAQALGVRSMALVSQAVLRAALMREESRSEHYREDFPVKDDARWRMQIAISLRDDHLFLWKQLLPEEAPNRPDPSSGALLRAGER